MKHDIEYAPGAGCMIHHSTCWCGEGCYQMPRRRHPRTVDAGVVTCAIGVVMVTAATWCAACLWLSTAAW